MMGGLFRSSFNSSCEVLMKSLSVISLLIVLSGCAAVIPKPDQASSVVYLSADPKNTLLAESIDGSTVNDGRYFTVTPGHHLLEVLVLTDSDTDSTTQDFVDLDVADFQSDRSYRLVLTDNTISRDLKLLDEDGTVIREISI
ncbi:hypothetical protein ALO83_103223 [Pseudomonas cannabina pv. alisalensis]|nr:hypothetical protein ALO83_103223 [Pseudomonas cannabina pv. alisalensis]